MSNIHVNRYARQLRLPQWDDHAQRKIENSSVLVVGCGALGIPVLTYLSAAGVGRIGLVDDDNIEMSNLHRQIIYREDQIGRNKAAAAEAYILERNSEVQVEVFQERLTSENAFEIAKEYQTIVDCTDNFPTRYLINDLCVLSDKENVHGSIEQFSGQVAVFNALFEDGSRSANYRDLYPEPPNPDEVVNCEEGGVLGPLCGVIGSYMALEVLKLCSGVGQPFVNEFLRIDTEQNIFHRFKYSKNPENPLSGSNPSQTTLIDYNQFCGLNKKEKMNEINVQELKEMMDKKEDFVLIDVREQHEFDLSNLDGKLIPLGQIPERFSEIPKDKKVVVHCRMGGRSANAIQYLQQAHGYDNLSNLAGGITAWASYIDPSMPV